MYKTITTLLLISTFFVSLAQQLPKEKTQHHQQINGTNIFMVPPDSYSASNNFKGFQNPLDPTSMIMIVEIPGPYSEISKGFNYEMLKSKGMELKTKKETNISDFKALLIELDQPANGMIFSKHILIYGNEKTTTLINGIYSKDSLQLGEKIKQSVLSTFIDSNLKSDPRASLSYSLNENTGALKFKAVMGNGMLFNRDLKTPTESIDKAALLVDKSFLAIEIENKKLFCISRLKKYQDDYSVIPSKGINEVEIDNLKGYELFAKNNDKVDEEMYQVILFDEGGGYFLFVGTYLPNSHQAIVDIKNIIKTFKRKK